MYFLALQKKRLNIFSSFLLSLFLWLLFHPNFGMLLNEKDLEISNKVMEYLELIASYNNNKKLKLDLEKIMINCQRNNIEGLI